mgnify:CR=1 FL=1
MKAARARLLFENPVKFETLPAQVRPRQVGRVGGLHFGRAARIQTGITDPMITPQPPQTFIVRACMAEGGREADE